MRTLSELTEYAQQYNYPLIQTVKTDQNHDFYAVDLSQLYDSLHVKVSINRWFKKIKKEYGYTENRDYLVQNSGKSKSKVPHYVSASMANDMCMMRKTENGDLMAEFYQEYRQVIKQEEIRRLRERVEQMEKKLGIVGSIK